MNNLINFSSQLMNSLTADGDNQLMTILKAVIGTLVGIAFLLVAIGAIRAGIALSQATNEEDGARHKKRLINCIIGAVVCAVAEVVAQVVMAVASGWVK